MSTELKVYEFHPIADIFPMLDENSVGFKALVEDIKERKQQEPVWLFEEKILDGRNRYRACQQLGIEVEVRHYHKQDPIGFVLSVNLHRRHLNESQRAMVAAKLADLDVGANQTTEGTPIGVAAKPAADTMKRLKQTIAVMKKAADKANEEAAEAA